MSVPPSLPLPELRARLDAGDPVAWTRTLVATPSVNPGLEAGGAGEGKMADLLQPALEGWGFRVTRHEPEPGRVSLVARRGEGSPTLALCGHLDTVGVTEMQVAPFEPREEGGRIHGRGAADMKSGVAAILAAAVRTRECAAGTLILVLTADEEHASLGLADLLQQGLDADVVVVTEPTELALAPANKGFLWLTVRARGVAAHGSRPDQGRDAIRQMARVVAALDEDELGIVGVAPHPLLGRASLHTGTIRGGVAPSVYPEACVLELEVRLLPGQDPVEVEARLQALAHRVEAQHPGVALEVERGMVRPPAELSPDSEWSQGFLRAMEAEGLAPRVDAMTAWVESAWFMEAGIPAFCFGPGSIGEAHTATESVPMAEIEAAARVLERWIRQLHSPSGNSALPHPADREGPR